MCVCVFEQALFFLTVYRFGTRGVRWHGKVLYGTIIFFMIPKLFKKYFGSKKKYYRNFLIMTKNAIKKVILKRLLKD